MRHRAVRRLHRSSRWQSHSLLYDPHERARRQQHNNHRAPFRGRFLPGGVLAGSGSYPGTHASHATLHPGVYVGIDTDGTVYIVAHRSEMGTGIRTSLPLVLADELDADWTRVKIEQAIGDARYGSQETDGSQSIREFYDAMREAGATARLMLTRAAAQQ